MHRSRAVNAIVRAYRQRFQRVLAAQLRTFSEEPTIEAAVIRAARAETPDGRRYSHQRRIPKATLAESRERLLGIEYTAIRSFVDLHSTVARCIGSIHRAGELLVYDTSLRIGAKLSLMPNRVYLHSGTRKGVRNLGLRWNRDTMELAELPAAFRELKAHEIEDCLCIFKDAFAGTERPNANPCP